MANVNHYLEHSLQRSREKWGWDASTFEEGHIMCMTPFIIIHVLRLMCMVRSSNNDDGTSVDKVFLVSNSNFWNYFPQAVRHCISFLIQILFDNMPVQTVNGNQSELLSIVCKTIAVCWSVGCYVFSSFFLLMGIEW